MKYYKKKPIPVPAVEWTGLNIYEIWDFVVDKDLAKSTSRGYLLIHTLEGDMKAQIGDYIIKGVRGEFYPCKPDIFKETYEECSPVAAPVLQTGEQGAVEILKELCQLKHYKDEVGKDSFYEKRQPELWEQANDYLNSLSSQPISSETGTGERFKRPTDNQLVKAAILFNDGVVDHKKLADMVALSEWVIDRLYENGDVSIPSSNEKIQDETN